MKPSFWVKLSCTSSFSLLHVWPASWQAGCSHLCNKIAVLEGPFPSLLIRQLQKAFRLGTLKRFDHLRLMAPGLGEALCFCCACLLPALLLSNGSWFITRRSVQHKDRPRCAYGRPVTTVAELLSTFYYLYASIVVVIFQFPTQETTERRQADRRSVVRF
ncbi:hypothetical protein T4C_4202 [Trichinella pseudospiralis]|uniref:Uncharacterized protein n=1 Tax=Trichinella pseudospiralis TaxID=6337 RepID=A0A0V1IXZ4_TRIPS|nr:hypothetical protein T4C_4202 [Trichinella pseudospiralis]